jgi:phage tail sheath protein FI
MPEFIAPGVYVEEVHGGPSSIEGVITSAAGFVAATPAGPTDRPVLVASLDELEETFGDRCCLWHAARAFFQQGGRRLFVQRVLDSDYEAGLRALEQVGEVGIVAAPGAQVATALVEHAERMRYRFAVLDPPRGQTVQQMIAARNRIDSSHAALYYPWLRVGGDLVPPSGFVAGIYARNDAERGVFRAPATEVVAGATGLETSMSEHDVETLCGSGINPFRVVESGPVLVWGARTLSADPEWKYVNLRRYFIYLEQSIDRGTQWTVLEPNGEELWTTLRGAICNFLLDEFRRGGLAGETPEDAFFVRCDRSTMTQDDLDAGRLVCVVGVAPVRPAEFVEIRIGRWTADRRFR